MEDKIKIKIMEGGSVLSMRICTIIVCTENAFMQAVIAVLYEVYGLLIIWGFRFSSGYAIIQ